MENSEEVKKRQKREMRKKTEERANRRIYERAINTKKEDPGRNWRRKTTLTRKKWAERTNWMAEQKKNGKRARKRKGTTMKRH